MGVQRSAFAFARITLFDFSEFVRELLVRRFRSHPFPARFAVALVNELHHVFERCPGEENRIHAPALHFRGVLARDRATATAEHLDVLGAFFAQKIDNFGEELDVPAVIARNPNCTHVLLNSGAHDIADRTMIAEIDDLNPVPDKLEIDGVDRAVVPIANRDSGKNANWRSHLSKR